MVFVVLCVVKFFFLLMFPLKQFNITLWVQEVCLEDSQEYSVCVIKNYLCMA